MTNFLVCCILYICCGILTYCLLFILRKKLTDNVPRWKADDEGAAILLGWPIAVVLVPLVWLLEWLTEKIIDEDP